MVWPMVIMAAMKGIQGYEQQQEKNRQTEARNIVNSANVYASNLVRKANNELSANRASLQRFAQVTNNKRTLDNTGEAEDAAEVNYLRHLDANAGVKLEEQIAFSEQAGAQAAMAATSGLTGGVADLVAGTTALRRGRIEQRARDTEKAIGADAAKRQRDIALAGWDSLDHTDITANLDFSEDVYTPEQMGKYGIMDFFADQDPKDMANLGSAGKDYFMSKKSPAAAAASE